MLNQLKKPFHKILGRYILLPCWLAFLLVFSGWLISCDYELHEVPMNDKVKQPYEGPPIQINLNGYHDTIKVGGRVNFSYSISGTNNKILAVEISIDNTILHQYVADNKQSFSFVLDPADLPNGQYNLHISVITSSGTGSIAEKLGGEGYQYELDWPILIDKAGPSGDYAISFEKVHSPEGVKLTWTAFNHVNFFNYVVYRQYRVVQQQPEAIAVIANPLQSYYIDLDFWEGQDAVYFVRIVTQNDHYDGSMCNFTDQLSGLSATWHNNGTIDVRWNMAQNTASFGGYYVFTSYSDTPTETQLVSNPKDTSCTFQNPGLPNGINIYFAIIPKNLPAADYNNLKLYRFSASPPVYIPLFLKTCRVNNHDFLLLSTQSKVYRYYPHSQISDDTLAVSQTIYELLSVSNDGNQFAIYDGKTFHIINTGDFHEVISFTDPSIPNPESVLCISLSDNDQLMVVDSWDQVYLYDIGTGLLINKDTIILNGYNQKTAVLAPDGKSMVGVTGSDEVSLFTLGASGWTITGKAAELIHHIMYSEDGMYVYLVTYESLIKRRTSDFGLESELSLPVGYYRSFDMERERILCSQYYGPEFFIVDIQTGEILKSINLGYGQYSLFKNYVIASGRQLELPDL